MTTDDRLRREAAWAAMRSRLNSGEPLVDPTRLLPPKFIAEPNWTMDPKPEHALLMMAADHPPPKFIGLDLGGADFSSIGCRRCGSITRWGRGEPMPLACPQCSCDFMGGQ